MQTRPQCGERHLFPTLTATAYLNHAAISPPSTPVLAAANQAMQDFACLGADAMMGWMEQRERLRHKTAQFLGTQPENIGFPPGTTRGIIDIAHAIEFHRGDKIICFEGEFPSNVIPWMTAAARSGAEVIRLPLEGFETSQGDGLQRVRETLLGGDVRLIAVSAVQFQTGLRMPLQELAQLAHETDAELFVDAIQALGAEPLNVETLGIDYLVAGTHKWLMGMEGLAIAYAAPAARHRLVPQTAGWLSCEDGLRFLFEGEGFLRYDRSLKKTLCWMESGVQTTAPFAALEASLDILTAIGPKTIAAHIQTYHNPLESSLMALGFCSGRAAIASARSGILSMRAPPEHSVLHIARGLAQRKIAVSTPDGWLRFAPHWPNHSDEVHRVVDAIKACLTDPGPR